MINPHLRMFFEWLGPLRLDGKIYLFSYKLLLLAVTALVVDPVLRASTPLRHEFIYSMFKLPSFHFTSYHTEDIL